MNFHNQKMLINPQSLLSKISLELDPDNPRWLEAEILVCYHLNLEKHDLFTTEQLQISESKWKAIKKDINLHKSGKPINYILGSKEFYNINFKVNQHVLIPRPESEQIVKEAVEYINTKEIDRPLNICDIGTGSGCLTFSIANSLPKRTLHNFYLVDISKQAIKCAKSNITTTSYPHTQFHFLLQDITTSRIDRRFDIILSNPPYISYKEYLELETNVREFEPEIALTDGKDGNTFYPILASICQKNLKHGGIAIFESSLKSISHNFDYFNLTLSKEFNISLIKDFTDRERFIKVTRN